MSLVDYVILFLMLAVGVVLILGIFNMMRGGNPQRSNRLMMWRVVLQGIVILLAALFLATGK